MRSRRAGGARGAQEGAFLAGHVSRYVRRPRPPARQAKSARQNTPGHAGAGRSARQNAPGHAGGGSLRLATWAGTRELGRWVRPRASRAACARPVRMRKRPPSGRPHARRSAMPLRAAWRDGDSGCAQHRPTKDRARVRRSSSRSRCVLASLPESPSLVPVPVQRD